ncbi:MAG: FHA domain-containing protein [Thermoplasmatota archaeon]
MRIAWSALLVGALFAGCVGGSHFVTARANLPVADRAAHAWNPNAKLGAIFGIEAHNLSRYRELAGNESLNSLAAVQSDPSAGDGLASGWVYVYGAGNASYAVSVSAAGSVLANKTERYGPLEPIQPALWHLDSDQAAQRAANANTTFRTLQGSAQADGFSMLAQGDNRTIHGHPFWVLFVQADRGNESAVMTVDADNGDTFPGLRFLAPGFNFTFNFQGFSFAEAGQAQGHVDATAPTREGDFTIGNLHTNLTMALQAQTATPPGQSASVTVTDPRGHTWGPYEYSSTTAFSEPTVSWHIPNPAIGRYHWTVQISSGLAGVSMDYDLSWCTNGVYVQYFGASPACDVGQPS